MSGPDIVSAYLRKAQRALIGAGLLLRNGDPDGACNRAYYAMFDAAYAALFAVAGHSIDGHIKTHGGLIGAFGLHLVKGKHLDAELGRSIHRVQHLRQLADYLGDPVPEDDAAWAVEQAAAFVDAIQAKFGGGPSRDPDAG